MLNINKILVVVFSLLLFGCGGNKAQKPNTMDEMVKFLDESAKYNKKLSSKTSKTPPSTITNSLVPELNISLKPINNGSQESRFDIAVKDVEAKDFFMGLVSGTKYSMVVNPEVTGIFH